MTRTIASLPSHPRAHAFLAIGRDVQHVLCLCCKGWADPEQFKMLRGTQSLPFRAGDQRRVAVKVVDFRGTEAIRILDLS